MVPTNNGHLCLTIGDIEKCNSKNEQNRRTSRDLTTKLGIYFREYCDYTGIHGFKYFGERRTYAEKIGWILIFVISLTICIGVICETYEKWQNSPIIINLASEENEIYEIPFPAITICHEVKISESYFNYSNILRSVANGTKVDDDSIRKLQYMSLLCRDRKEIPRFDVADENFFKFLNQGVTKFLRRCIWMNKVYPCHEIFQPLITDEGLCMTFNGVNMEERFKETVFLPQVKGDGYIAYRSDNWSADYGYKKDAGVDTYPRRALLHGTRNALTIIMDVDVNDLDYVCSSCQGFRLVLHNPIRYPIVREHYLKIPLGKSVLVAVSTTGKIISEKVKRYSIEKRKCSYQNEVELEYFRHYTEFNCQLDCWAFYTLQRCGCVAFFMPRRNNTKICGNAKSSCIIEVRNDLDMAGLKEFIDRDNPGLGTSKDSRYCICMPMCSSNVYMTETTETDFDLPKQREAIDDDNYTEEKNSTSQVIIYFKDGNYISYERNELYNHLDFLGNVGGLLGLFVGFSLLSFFEIIYFLSIRLICNLKLYKNWYGKNN